MHYSSNQPPSCPNSLYSILHQTKYHNPDFISFIQSIFLENLNNLPNILSMVVVNHPILTMKV